MKWLLEGDRNTRFFHCMASGRRRRNAIGEMSFDGVPTSSREEISGKVADFFEYHYKNVD